MSNKIEDILAQCIEDIKAGKSSVADCLDKYPAVRKQLEPLLKIALEIREPPDVKPSPAFKVRARVQLMEQIHARQAVTKQRGFRFTEQVKPIPHKRRFNMVAIIVAVVLAVSSLGGGTAYASQDSLPGDVLYPVKLGTEQARLVVATSNAAKAELHLAFAESRVEEMTALAERGRPEDVDIAVNGYDEAMAMAMEKMEEASGKGLDIADISELVAEATSKHLSALDEVYEKVPDEAKPAIERAREVSINRLGNASQALAGENPVRAMEINLAAMEGRLNRANDEADANNTEGVADAMGEFLALSGFGQEISSIAQELGEDEGTTVDELVATATRHHLDILAAVLAKLEALENVPDQAKAAIEKAIAVSERGRTEATDAIDAGPSGDARPP